MKLDFLETFSKNTQTSNFVKIGPVGAVLFHTADGQTYRHMTEIIVAFRDFSKARNKQGECFYCTSCQIFMSTENESTSKHR